MNFGFAISDFGLRRKAVRKIIRSESLSVKSKSKIQNLKWVGIFAIAFTFAFNGADSAAQQTGKLFRIGFLDPSNASGSAVVVDVFRQELRKLGWVEGKNISIEYRFAEQKPERVAELAAELVRLKVDLIVTSGVPPALEAKKATSTIPIVMVNVGDPLGLGLVASLARPGGNITGVCDSSVRAEYQKIGGAEGCGTQARPSWTSAVVVIQPGGRTTTQGAQGCSSGAEGKIGGDQDSVRPPKFRDRL